MASSNGDVPNLGPQLNITIWVLVGASGIFLWLRIYCKIRQKRGLWWDDHMLVASWGALIVSAALTAAGVSLGFGKHRSDLDRDGMTVTQLLYNTSSTFSITASAWSKTSFALTMLRLHQGRTRAVIWFIIVSVNLTKAASASLAWISCRPVYKAWEPFADGTCWDRRAVAYCNLFSGAYSGVMDVVLAFLPWPLLLPVTLSMRRREKFGIAVAMSMGIFAGITAFIKCSKIPTLLSGDFTFEGTSLAAWGSAETATTIMAASIPVLRVLVIRNARSSTGKGYGSLVAYELGTTANKDPAGKAVVFSVGTVAVTRQQSPKEEPKGKIHDDWGGKAILDDDSTDTFPTTARQISRLPR